MEGLLQAVACGHDEIVIECDEVEANKGEAWVKKAMVDGMAQVLNLYENARRPVIQRPTIRELMLSVPS
jgi:hypothetical protein